MIHPSQNYVFGGKMGVAKCLFENEEIEVSNYAIDVEKGTLYFSVNYCGCAWAGTNLQYLEYLYDKKQK